MPRQGRGQHPADLPARSSSAATSMQSCSPPPHGASWMSSSGPAQLLDQPQQQQLPRNACSYSLNPSASAPPLSSTARPSAAPKSEGGGGCRRGSQRGARARSEDLGACGGAGAGGGEGEVESVLERGAGSVTSARTRRTRDGARRDKTCLQTGAARGELGPRQRVEKLQHPRRARHARLSRAGPSAPPSAAPPAPHHQPTRQRPSRTAPHSAAHRPQGRRRERSAAAATRSPPPAAPRRRRRRRRRRRKRSPPAQAEGAEEADKSAGGVAPKRVPLQLGSEGAPAAPLNHPAPPPRARHSCRRAAATAAATVRATRAA